MGKMDYSLFKDAFDRGIITEEYVQVLRDSVESMKRKEIVKDHEENQSAIWKNDKGYWVTYIPDPTKKDNRRQVSRRNKEKLIDLLVEFYKDCDMNPTFGKCYKDWSSEKLANGFIQKQTYDRYETDYTRFLSDFGNNKVKDIDDDMLYAFIMNTIMSNNLTAKSWGNLRTLIKGTLKYAKRKHFTDFSVGTFFADLDIDKHAYEHRVFSDEESVFTESEVQLLCNEMDKEPSSVLCDGIRLLIFTGLRIGELSALTYEDMDKQHGVLNVYKTEVRYKTDSGYAFTVRESTKGKYGRRQVPLVKDAIEIIENAHDRNPEGTYLFEKAGKRVRGKAFSDKLVRLCRQAGIPPRSGHKMRKTFVTELKKSGMDAKAISKVVGHVQVETSDKYYYFNNTERDAIAKAMDSALENLTQPISTTDKV